MNPSRLFHAVSAAALSLACGSKPAGPIAPVSTGQASSTTPASLDLAELARSIDPGEVQPIANGAPPVVAEMFDGPSGADSIEELAEYAVKMADGMIGLPEGPNINLRQLLVLVYLADQMERGLDQCDLVCLAAAERIYAVLDNPLLTHPDGFFAEAMAMGGSMTAGMPKEQTDALFAFLRGVFESAPRHHRHVAARILRRFPDSDAATNTLRDLASSADRGHDLARAVRLHQAVVARQTGGSKFSDLASLASACVRLERLPCAEDAIRQARAAREPDPPRIAALEKGLAATRRIQALAGAPGFAERLERANLLVDVGRANEAVTLLDALAAERPRDARPLVVQARSWFAQDASRKASELVERARGLDRLEQPFYELAVGLTFHEFLRMVPALRTSKSEKELVAAMAGSLPHLRADIDGLARFRPGLGAVLRILADRMQEVVALVAVTDPVARRRRIIALSRSALSEAMALRQRLPDEPDVYRLIFLTARFGARPGEHDAAAVAIPAGIAGRDELLVMKAGLLYSQAVAWSDASRIPEIKRALESLSAEGARQNVARHLHTDLLALDARVSRRASLWPEAVTAYRALAADATDDDKGRILDNLGVALWESGDRDGARTAWAESVERGDANQVARLNSLVTGESPPTDQLDSIAESSEKVAVKAQALLWKIHLGHIVGKPRRAILAHIDELLRDDFIDDSADGSTGVVLEETFNVGVGYSTTDRIIVSLSLGRQASLVIPAPIIARERGRTRHPRRNETRGVVR